MMRADDPYELEERIAIKLHMGGYTDEREERADAEREMKELIREGSL